MSQRPRRRLALRHRYESVSLIHIVARRNARAAGRPSLRYRNRNCVPFSMLWPALVAAMLPSTRPVIGATGITMIPVALPSRLAERKTDRSGFRPPARCDRQGVRVLASGWGISQLIGFSASPWA
jgi:hypothetical protein